MANVKMTQKDFFNAIKATLQGEEVSVPVDDMVTFIDGRLKQLTKKSTNRKSASTSEENIALKARVADALSTLGQATVTQIMKADDELGELSNQKVSAILRMLMADGAVDRIKDKKTTLFFLIEED